jgi:O-acetyl-ADP-ribose deacetylase (regulator of RNase III)
MIEVLLADLVAVEAEGILRSVSSDLTSDTALSRALELAAGSGVVERLSAMGDLPVGGAVITPAGDLNASFLIHAVIQSPEEPVTATGTRLALQNGLRRAEEWGLETLALPPLGTGAGNLDAEASAGFMVPLLQDHLLSFHHPGRVTLVVGSEYEEDVFRQAVEVARRRASALEN